MRASRRALPVANRSKCGTRLGGWPTCKWGDESSIEVLHTHELNLKFSKPTLSAFARCRQLCLPGRAGGGRHTTVSVPSGANCNDTALMDQITAVFTGYSSRREALNNTTNQNDSMLVMFMKKFAKYKRHPEMSGF